MNAPHCPRCASRALVYDGGPYCLACGWERPRNAELPARSAIPIAIPEGRSTRQPYARPCWPVLTPAAAAAARPAARR